MKQILCQHTSISMVKTNFLDDIKLAQASGGLPKNNNNRAYINIYIYIYIYIQWVSNDIRTQEVTMTYLRQSSYLFIVSILPQQSHN